MEGEGCPMTVEWECDDGVLGIESECLATFLIICSLRSANSFLNASIAALQYEENNNTNGYLIVTTGGDS